jgi:hypothetical protein
LFRNSVFILIFVILDLSIFNLFLFVLLLDNRIVKDYIAFMFFIYLCSDKKLDLRGHHNNPLKLTL